MIEVKGFVCSYCKAAKRVKRVYATRGSCARHEDVCFRNEETKSCATCSLWVDDDNTFNVCEDEHDCADTGNLNGLRHDPSPVSNCRYWKK